MLYKHSKVKINLLLLAMSTFILQWNIRGLNQNYTSGLQPLLANHNPDIVSIQETKLANEKFNIRNYEQYHHINKKSLIAAGGTSLYVRNGLPQKEIKLQTTLQAVAVRVSSFKPISICSLYLPPGENFTLNQLLNILTQLPKPYIILGDFNAHSPLWGNEGNPDIKGKIVEDFLLQTNTCILNDSSHTYLIPANFKTTSVDLSMSSPDLAPNLEWTTLDDTYFSDHYPIVIKNSIPSIAPQPEKFIFKKANWHQLSEDCKTQLNLNTKNKTIEFFTETLTEITEKNIPKTSSKPRKNKSWFNEKCTEAVKNKKRKFRIAKNNPTPDNIKNFKIAQAHCRQTCRQEKKKSFEHFISKINKNTPMTKIWKMIKKLNGTNKESVKHIQKEDGTIAETEKEIANEIAQTLSKNSSLENHNKNFLKNKNDQEKQPLDFSSNNLELYNQPFTISDLTSTLSELKQTAAGPDNISNMILSHLPPETIQLLLHIINKNWENKTFPDSWHSATIIPIPKQGKDHSNPSNYRPIALTSCLCKVMEKMVYKRLSWYLETNNLLSNLQSGFRKNRSTTDQLIRLETFIKNALSKKEHVTVIFFDLEKAFDVTWKYGILKDLHNMGLRGHLPEFIESFLQNRTFQTKVGSSFSDWFTQEEGVPQGSILSPLLFEIKINSITETLSPNTNKTLYVDDFAIAYSSNAHLNHTERFLQLQLSKLETWADNNGMKFSTTKTQIVHFCKRRDKKCNKSPNLFLYNENIKVVDQIRFLGVIFDKKLSFIPHLKHLKTKCLQALNAFKILCNPEWGGNPDTLLTLYKSLILSKLDYGCQIYGSACPSYLKMLDTIQNQGLRLALGAFRTSPETSLQAEASILPLELRRKQLTLQYAIKISATPENPVFNCLFNTPTNIKRILQKKPKTPKPISERISPDLKEINFNVKDTQQITFPTIPSWTLNNPEIDLDLTKFTKESTHPSTYREEFYKILRNKYVNHAKIYTDGSKSDFAVGAASVPIPHELEEKYKRLPNSASIYTAEATALNMALDAINISNDSTFLILTDSLSCLKAIKDQNSMDPRIQKIKQKIHYLSLKNKTISFLWTPSHVGIEGNDMADELAKESLNSTEISQIKIPYTDLIPIVKTHIKSKWETIWSNELNNKLHKIQPKLRPRLPLNLNRKNQVKYTRLKIGHTRLTHEYLLSGEDRPLCTCCSSPLTIEHILCNCSKFSNTRKNFFRTTNIKTIFSLSSPTKILNFFKQINLYDKI